MGVIYNMKALSRMSKIIVAVLLVSLLAGGLIYLKIDNDRPAYQIIDIDEDLLKVQLGRLAAPKEKIEGEDTVKQDGFKGIIEYHILPVDALMAHEYIDNFKYQQDTFSGTYTPLSQENSGCFVGPHYYSSVLDKLGYGWLSYEGNLYADYHGRQQAKNKPNYRNRYTFSFVTNEAVYSAVVFCNQKNPEKALISAVDYICSM